MWWWGWSRNGAPCTLLYRWRKYRISRTHNLGSFRKRNAIPTVLYIALFTLVIISVSLAQFAARASNADPFRTANSRVGAFEISRIPPDYGEFNASAMLNAQAEAFRMISMPGVGCSFSAWHHARYASLASSSDSKSILLALNLIDAQHILPNLLVQLPQLLRFLGPHNVHISVYENGSGDLTQSLLVALARVLDAVGTSFTIISRGKTEIPNKEFDHRIESLAMLRNKVLAPLYDERISRHMPRGKFDEVFIINDIIWCPVDALEVIYQKRHTGAHQSCSVDWDWNMRVVYDRWVLRAISGRTWYDREELVNYWHDGKPLDAKTPPQVLPFDPEGRARFESLQPLQVFACWNGMSVFSASAFLDKGIRFRVGRSDHHGDGSRKEPTDIVSECYLTSVDLWKAGMGKIVLASRARVAYSIDDYNIYRKDWATGRLENLASSQEQELFPWVEQPPKEVAMQDLGWWENEERWAPWDEP